VSAGEVVLLGAAAFVAGGVNAVAGGGSLVSFPALLAVGYGSVAANVTNNVALVPGYFGGSLAYRRELEGQRRRASDLGATSAVGAAGGAALLLVGSASVFRSVVPFLILFACALLAAQPLLARLASGRGHRTRGTHLAVFAGAVYGGYFGAGLGIMLLAILGAVLEDDLQRLNALKGLLSLIISVVAAVAFAIFGPVAWGTALGMGAAAFAGGQAGVRVARRLSPAVLRTCVVVYGVGVAVRLLV
jgi:uncharacterized protein